MIASLPVVIIICLVGMTCGQSHVSPRMSTATTTTTNDRGPTCVLNLDVKSAGSLVDGVQFAYKMGFNAVFVPVQKTRDAYPRMIVSTDPSISRSTMMQLTQHSNEPVHLLGEFLGSTSNVLEVILMTAQEPNDVDMMIHEISQTPREASSFVLVIHPKLAALTDDGSDALSRYRALVPDGRAIIYFDEYSPSKEHDIFALELATSVGVDIIAVPATRVGEALLERAKDYKIHVGAFNADTRDEMKAVMNSTVSFFTTRSPWTYLSLTTPKSQLPVARSHAAVLLG